MYIRQNAADPLSKTFPPEYYEIQNDHKRLHKSSKRIEKFGCLTLTQIQDIQRKKNAQTNLYVY